MDSIPDAVLRWMRSERDPWANCARADWFIYVARHHGYSIRHVVQALARNLPTLQEHEPREMVLPLRELVARCAAGERPSSTLEEQIRRDVRPRLVDWNIARQYHGVSL